MDAEKTDTQAFNVRLPADLHQAARLKTVRQKVSLNEIIVAKLSEWVNEPESKQSPTPRVASGRRAKSAA